MRKPFILPIATSALLGLSGCQVVYDAFAVTLTAADALTNFYDDGSLDPDFGDPPDEIRAHRRNVASRAENQ